MIFTFNRMHMLFGFALTWLIFIILAETRGSESPFYPIIASLLLFVVPGFLTVLVLKLHRLALWSVMSLSVGFSILELMAIGLTANAFLPFFGIAYPLDRMPILAVFSLFTASLIALTWLRVGEFTVRLNFGARQIRTQDAAFVLIPPLFILLSIFGATLLNNGGGNVLVYVLLCSIGVYLLFLCRAAEDVATYVIPIALFQIALALLLMTSLRGSFITGHDIQREFEVFQLTKNSGIWSISAFRDAYNACMSITILPTILAHLTHMKDPYVYKILFQVLFAIVPPMLFSILRRYTGALVALLATIYFIAFPTFFTDMPFLNRQEIAFLFLFLMFLVMGEDTVSVTMRRILVSLFGLGMILSHYSTTYSVIALLLGMMLVRPVVYFLAPYVRRMKYFKDSGVLLLQGTKDTPFLTYGMLGILIGATFLWSSVLTDTSSNSLYRVVYQTFAVIGDAAGEESRSNDVRYGLFSGDTISPEEALQNYEEQTVRPRRESAEVGTYYDDSILAQYPLVPQKPAVMPLTALGLTLEEEGWSIESINNAVRQSSAKVLQLLILIGAAYVIFSRRFLVQSLGTEYVILAGGSLAFLVAIIVLPVLSAEYGLLRAFQQSLLFLGLFIVLGSLALFARFGDAWARRGATTLAILFFLSSTGVFTQALGGYDAQLHLNNAGTYFDLYHMRRSDILATEWLLVRMQEVHVIAYQSGVTTNTDLFISRDLTDGIEVSKNIYPGLIRQKSFVLVGGAILESGRGSVLHNSDVLSYQYPIEFLDTTKNRIYSNGTNAIYR